MNEIDFSQLEKLQKQMESLPFLFLLQKYSRVLYCVLVVYFGYLDAIYFINKFISCETLLFVPL